MREFGDSLLWELGGIPRADHTQYRRLIQQLSGYMAEAPADDPVAYPGSSDAVLARFPPTLVVTGSRAVDFSAAVESHRRLARLGAHASLYVMDGAGTRPPMGREARPKRWTSTPTSAAGSPSIWRRRPRPGSAQRQWPKSSRGPNSAGASIRGHSDQRENLKLSDR